LSVKPGRWKKYSHKRAPGDNPKNSKKTGEGNTLEGKGGLGSKKTDRPAQFDILKKEREEGVSILLWKRGGGRKLVKGKERAWKY